MYKRQLLLLNSVSFLLFLRVYRKGFSNTEQIDQVVRTAIKAFSDDNTDAVIENKTQPKRRMLQGLFPFRFGKENVERIDDIPYGDESERQTLDVYLPKADRWPRRPILIQLPGGAWVTGSNKEQGLPLLHRMASEGWACFSVCYRLAPDDRFPAMLEDVLRAIAWIKENAETYLSLIHI